MFVKVFVKNKKERHALLYMLNNFLKQGFFMRLYLIMLLISGCFAFYDLFAAGKPIVSPSRNLSKWGCTRDVMRRHIAAKRRKAEQRKTANILRSQNKQFERGAREAFAEKGALERFLEFQEQLLQQGQEVDSD